MDTPLLQTARTRITLLHSAQAPLLADYCLRNRAHLAPWEGLRSESFFETDECAARLEKNQLLFLEGVAVTFAVLNQDGSRMIAACNLSNIVRGLLQACHFGYSVCASHQGQGIMHEAAQAVIGYAFSDLQLHRIMANYMPRNLRSERLLLRLGFSREGYAKAYLKIAGQWEDHVLTALINPAHI